MNFEALVRIAFAFGILGGLALIAGALLRIVRYTAAVGGRLLISCGVGGALAAMVAYATSVVFAASSRRPDEIGAPFEAAMAYFFGAAIGLLVFAVREFAVGEKHDSAD